MTRARIALMRPLLPHAQDLLHYLTRIDENRWYSNSGPLAQEFQARLAGLFGIAAGAVVPVANGTLALQLALRATARPGPRKCLMPAWTFAATPLAAMQAGLEPHFADIDPATWALDPHAIAQRRDLAEFSAILPVAPFGRPPDVEAWNAVMAETGIPVVIDAAAGFDGMTSRGSTAAMPVMISLHATKPLGTGEGGIVIANDEATADELARARNFGFDGAPVAQIPGTNAKLSEYHAAIGLAALDTWPHRRSALAAAQAHYTQRLRNIENVELMPGLGDDWTSTTLNIATGEPMQQVIARLAAHGIEARPWWGPGCHTHPAFAGCPRDPLPNTDALAPAVLGLPLSPDMTREEIGRVCDALAQKA